MKETDDPRAGRQDDNCQWWTRELITWKLTIVRDKWVARPRADGNYTSDVKVRRHKD